MPVINWKASTYFSRVFCVTFSGRSGAGGFLFHQLSHVFAQGGFDGFDFGELHEVDAYAGGVAHAVEVVGVEFSE